MATRSRIAIEHVGGLVESIYCHWDGYPSGNGKTLFENYKTEEQVKDLIKLGDISSLGATLEETVAYHRDRGEAYNAPTRHADAGDYLRSDVEEYGYIYRQGEWFVIDGYMKGLGFMHITEAILAGQ